MGHDPNDQYLYKDSGIHERSGAVPNWLKLVYAGILAWGIWYLITYWNSNGV